MHFQRQVVTVTDSELGDLLYRDRGLVTYMHTGNCLFVEAGHFLPID